MHQVPKVKVFVKQVRYLRVRCTYNSRHKNVARSKWANSLIIAINADVRYTVARAGRSDVETPIRFLSLNIFDKVTMILSALYGHIEVHAIAQSGALLEHLVVIELG